MPTRTQDLASVWGTNLWTARTQAGWTQVELADRIGISQYTISRIESGHHRPADDTKFKLADAFDISVETLFPYSIEGVA